jgi:hypothetical protein
VLDDLIYFWLHRLLGQPPAGDVVIVTSYSLIGTTITGTAAFLLLDYLLKERARNRKPEMFPKRRQTRRRNPIKL